jgi:biotin synthase
MSRELQALCFTAGANSIFVGAKLLTTPLPGQDEDSRLMADMGLRPMPAPQDMAPVLSVPSEAEMGSSALVGASLFHAEPV